MGDTNSPLFKFGKFSHTKNKKVGVKLVKPSGSAFTQFKDVLLCESWCNTSMDPICGTEQKGEKYWDFFGNFTTSKNTM